MRWIPDVALAQPETMDQIREETMSDQRFTLVLFGSFAVVALFLAALGIYGVMAFSRGAAIARDRAPHGAGSDAERRGGVGGAGGR